MILALSTHWNAPRHTSGREIVREILDLGIVNIELGYDLTIDLVPGIQEAVRSGEVKVVSVHAICPVPVGIPRGHPEVFTIAHYDRRVRSHAVSYLKSTILFAAEIGAGTVVAHAGNVDMPITTPRLFELCRDGRQFSPKYDSIKTKLILRRERKAALHVSHVVQSLKELAPVLETSGVRLALENLPYWESVPTEMEMVEIIERVGSPSIGYWYDTGHGQMRQNLGFISTTAWLDRLRPRVFGMHAHDLMKPDVDHLMPPNGSIDFGIYSRFVTPDLPVVLEPAPGTPAGQIADAAGLLSELWGRTPAA